jgi:MerR family Zn(II)-responsive transcriptional regulator of zntA
MSDSAADELHDSPSEDLSSGEDDAQTDPCRRARGLTTGDLARKCETTLRTVRFYEEAGILCPESRSEGGHRVFGSEDLSKLQLVMDLREAGLSLQDIKELFELKRKHTTPEAASAAMQCVLESQIEEMQRKIATLRKLREELAQTVAIIQECRTCVSAEFPKQCAGCDVVDRPELPRALRLLWGLF